MAPGTAGWAQYGDMKTDEAKCLRQLETENARLKKLPAEAELDTAMLQEMRSLFFAGGHEHLRRDVGPDPECGTGAHLQMKFPHPAGSGSTVG